MKRFNKFLSKASASSLFNKKQIATNHVNYANLPFIKQEQLRFFSSTKPSRSSEICCTIEDIEEAYKRTSALMKPTPLHFSPRMTNELQNIVGHPLQIFFKFENKHHTGSFKERGAINKLVQLDEAERKRGVIAASAGNHAQAVAFHAQRMGISATIFMPESTPYAKVSGTLQYGAKVVLHGESLDDAYKEAVRVGEEEGRVFIHPFNDPAVIAGQGTLGLELMEQNPYFDAVIIPVGGGGLISGTALAMKSVNPRIKVYGVEAENMPGMKKSIENKVVTKIPFTPTIADGIAVKHVGELTFSIIQEYVDDIVTVTDDEIANAVLALLEKEKTMTEGAGAAAFAALQFNKLKIQEKRICVVLSGGNIDVSVLREIIDRGLVKSSRLARLRIVVPDAPGQLVACLEILAKLRCNVREVEHERAFLKSPVGYTAIYVTIQTKGREHLEEVSRALSAKNYHYTFDF